MPRDKFQAMLNCITRLNGLADFFHLAGLSSAANNSSLSRRRCTSAIVSNKCQLSQMDPRDELPHLHRSVHRGEHRVRLSGQSSSVKRRPPNGRYSSGRGKIFQVHSLGQSSRRTYRYFWRYSNFLTTQCGIGRRTKKGYQTQTRSTCFDRTPTGGRQTQTQSHRWCRASISAESRE